MTLEVDLGDEGEAVVAGLVSNGSFASPDEVLRKGVELLVARDEALRRLHAALEAAELDQAEGRLVDAEDAFDEMDARIAAAFREKAAAA